MFWLRAEDKKRWTEKVFRDVETRWPSEFADLKKIKVSSKLPQSLDLRWWHTAHAEPISHSELNM